MIRAGLISGKVFQKDYDISALLQTLLKGSSSTYKGHIIRGMTISYSTGVATLAPGQAIILVQKTGVSNDIFSHIEVTSNETISVSSTCKVWLSIAQDKVDNGLLHSTDGSGIAVLSTGASYPGSGRYIPLATITAGVVTQEGPSFKLPDSSFSLLGKLLAEIGDVSDATANENDYLKRVGGLWIPTPLSQSDLPTVSVVNEKRFYAGEALASKDAVFLETQYSPDFITSQTDNGGSATYNGWSSSGPATIRLQALKTLKLCNVTLDTPYSNVINTFSVLDDSNNVLCTIVPQAGNYANVEAYNLVFQKNQYFKIQYNYTGGAYYTNEKNTATGTNISIVSASGRVYSQGGAIASVTTKSEYVDWDDIGAVSAHTRQSYPIFFNGSSSNSIELYLSKIGSPSTSCIIEIQSDNAGLPSGTVLASATIAPGTITADGKYTITLSATLSQAIGVKGHLVAKQTSDTVNSSNYYRIGCLAGKHTTTRNRNLWNGSAWVADTSGIFPLAYSAFMLYTLLSKCDDDYWYKSSKYGLAITSYTVGQLVECHRDGLVTGLSLGGSGPVYLSNTPGLYSLTKGTSGIMIGYSQDGTSMRIYVNDVEEKIGLVGCTQSDNVQHLLSSERTVTGGFTLAKQFIPKYTGTVKINFQGYYSDGNNNYLSAEFRTTVGGVQTGYTATGTRNAYVALSMTCYVVAGMPCNIEIKGNGSSAGAKIKDVQICYNVTSLNTYTVLQD